MTDERVSAAVVIPAPADAVFAVLTDLTTHAEIDGTSRVLGPVGSQALTATGQLFRMAMRHEDHPDGTYETVNRVQVFEPPTTLCWETGYDAGGGDVRFAGWYWRYDLAPDGPSRTVVTLTYDWSAVPGSVRAYLSFPPFSPGHLERSLTHLAELTPTTRGT